MLSSVYFLDLKGKKSDRYRFFPLHQGAIQDAKLHLVVILNNLSRPLDCFLCRIGHDNKGGFAGWYLDRVLIDVPSLGQRLVFPCGRWLDKDKDDGQLERELQPGVDTEEAYTPCENTEHVNQV